MLHVFVLHPLPPLTHHRYAVTVSSTPPSPRHLPPVTCPIHPCLLLSIGAPPPQASPPQSASTAAPSARPASTPCARSTKSTGGRRSPSAPTRPVSPPPQPPAAAQTPTPAQRCSEQQPLSVGLFPHPASLPLPSLTACLPATVFVSSRCDSVHVLPPSARCQKNSRLMPRSSFSHAGAPEPDAGQQ